MKKKFLKVSDFFQIKDFYSDYILTKNNNIVKIIEIIPLNINLKNDFEKEMLLNSYKNFLNDLNSNIQIVIQSIPIDLNEHIENIKQNQKGKINDLMSDYILYIQNIKNQILYFKKFYIIFSPKTNEKTKDQAIEIARKEALKILNGIKRIRKYRKNY